MDAQNVAMSSPRLLVDWCSYDAAKWAVEHWHYSRIMPSGKLARLGVWEDGAFIGAVVFGTGANFHLAEPFGLERLEVCELVRVALRAHATPVSRILSIAIRILTRKMPGIRLIVSYADTAQGHIGKIYQASNWTYIGVSDTSVKFRIRGKVLHSRTVRETYKGMGRS